MITNLQTWAAFDKMAKLNHISLSALALRSGLNSTTFNKSKRVFPTGQERWPSMCTLVKVLNTLNMSFADFAKLFTEDNK